MHADRKAPFTHILCVVSFVDVENNFLWNLYKKDNFLKCDIPLIKGELSFK